MSGTQPTPSRSTADHHLDIRGRAWRATDPAIPSRLRSELVAELMAARREVGRAGRHQDEGAERAARRRVQDAKVALGERGPAWWEPAELAAVEERLRSTILTLVRKRGVDSSICPSDAARVVGGEDGDWRSLMVSARSVAVALARPGQVRLTVHHEVVDPDALPAGPIRIALVPED